MKFGSSGVVLRKTACLPLVLAVLTLFTFLPAASPQPFEVKLVLLTPPVSPGNNATITVTTAANANCQISVLYKSGPSKAKGLFPQSADSQGRVTWTWRVGSNTTPGSWPIIVTCTTGGQKGVLKTPLVVR